MINADQIRAARALLNWRISDLAKQTGLTANGINNVELGHVQGRPDTLEKIQAAFENAGIEFLPDSGIRRKNRIVTTHEGEEANRALLDDVYTTLRDTGGEVLISGVDEKKAIDDVDDEFLMAHIERLKQANVTERLLIREGDTHFTVPLEWYRWVKPEYFSPFPFYIYGPKLALVSWAPSRRCVIIHDEAFAESARRMFNCVWNHSEVPRVPKKAKS